MSINSMIFLTAFLPVVFVLDRLCVRKTALKNILLLLASLVFYAWGEPVYIVLLLVSIAANYGIGLLLGRQRDESVAAKTVLAAGILVNLGILGYYKYFDFFLRIVNRLTGSEHEMRNIPLPIGISFFTFGAISYLMDLYRGHYEAEKNPLNMALYLSFFPKISVGPIARYRDFGPQLVNRQETVEKTAEGIRRFAYGLGKKVLVANIVGASVDKIYAQDITNVTGVMVWCAAILYAIQIYYDFSGFTDMAIGLGKMLGFDFNKNFDYPYISTSVSEFWRRWHISLGSWFRDYIYIPLGGNRVSTLKHIRNILVVWALTGLWHGASWNFVLWGVYYGLFLLLEKFVLQKYLKKIPSWLCTVYTMLVVMIGWVFFSQTDFGALGHYLGTMFGIGASGFIDKTALYYLKTGFILLLISILMCRPAPYQYFKRLVRRRPVAAVIINLILFALSIAYMVYNSYTPFLYAKF